MNKEQILAKSRDDMPKEEQRYLDMNSAMIAFKAINIVIAGIIIFNFITGQDIYDLIAIVYAGVAGQLYFKYKIYGGKRNKFFYISSIVASALFVVNHVVRILF